MKMNFRRLLIAAAAALTIGATSARADLVFATDTSAYPPFTSKNAAGEWVGWEYEFMNALCAEMNEKCTMTAIAWDGIIPALLEKKMDGILGSMSITNKRKEVIDFSDMYYNSAAVIIGARNGDMDFSPEHLSGKTIGVQGATIHQNYVDKYYVPKGAVSKAYQKQDEANADLAAGRVDYLMADGVALRDYLMSDEGKACCELKGAVPDDKEVLGYGVGVGLRKEDTALRDKINAAIKSLAARGYFEELTKKYGLDGLMKLPPRG
ncbi:transporter substrate-binding domain-containing protein [Aestuariivirga sp.]|uniref:transporter substrate-binding domain-containing protein n=1 Tax=Aestuariivirga sp. TaxID=2650926 RepID=UPI0025BF7340|nr:transporter substrate-binding domain-containing protein [Aestuariivirga sp.]MCA3555509.1 transporter substrate-binding domain-containing protein [Aestuariivirga sp.]